MINDVRRFIKKYELTERNLSYSTLENIFTSLGYKIIRFNSNRNSVAAQSLIDAYALNEFVSKRKVFIFTDGIVKLLFLHEYISEDELVHYMLHELGHIWFRHLFNTYDEDAQEREADEFAVQVKILLKLRHIMCNVIIIICIGMITFFVCTFLQSAIHINNNTDAPTASPAPTDMSIAITDAEISTRQVIVTKSGDKFHRADCQYVKNKTDTLSITIEEAINSGRTPCKVCRPTE